jgi:regulator of RNase E activity RraB
MIVKHLRKLFEMVKSKSTASSDSGLTPARTGENWATFKRYIGENFSLVTVDQNLISNKETNLMCWCVIDYHFRKDQLVNEMLPTPDVNSLCYDFEDKVDDAVAAIGGRMAATETGFGKRTVLYFAPSLKLERLMGELTFNFGDVPVQVREVESSQLNKYAPDHLQQLLSGNRQILDALAAQGDDGSTPREVTHWITNVEAGKLTYVSIALQQQGYSIVEAAKERIQFSRFCSLSLDSTTTETKKLNALCESVGCFYDGWETHVVKSKMH